MKVFSWKNVPGAIALGLAASALAAGTAQASQHSYPTAVVSYARTAVTAPAADRAEVRTSACMSVVYVYVIDVKTFQVIDSAAARGHGKAFGMLLRFPADIDPGTYETGGVFGRPCGARSGLEPLNPEHGYFTSRVVVSR